MSEYISAISTAVRNANPGELAHALHALHEEQTQQKDINPDLETQSYNALEVLESNVAPQAIHTGTPESPALALFLAPDQLRTQRPERRLAFWQVRRSDQTPTQPSDPTLGQWHAVSSLIDFTPYRQTIPPLRPAQGLVDRLLFPQFFHQQPRVADLQLQPIDEWYLVAGEGAVHLRIGRLPTAIEGLNGYWHEKVVPADQIPPQTQVRRIPNGGTMDEIYEQTHRLYRRGLLGRLRPTNYSLHYEAASPALVQ